MFLGSRGDKDFCLITLALLHAIAFVAPALSSSQSNTTDAVHVTRVSGRIVDAANVPVAGAKVEVLSTLTDMVEAQGWMKVAFGGFDAAQVLHGVAWTTAADGSFSGECRPMSRERFVISLPGMGGSDAPLLNGRGVGDALDFGVLRIRAKSRVSFRLQERGTKKPITSARAVLVADSTSNANEWMSRDNDTLAYFAQGGPEGYAWEPPSWSRGLRCQTGAEGFDFWCESLSDAAGRVSVSSVATDSMTLAVDVGDGVRYAAWCEGPKSAKDALDLGAIEIDTQSSVQMQIDAGKSEPNTAFEVRVGVLAALPVTDDRNHIVREMSPDTLCDFAQLRFGPVREAKNGESISIHKIENSIVVVASRPKGLLEWGVTKLVDKDVKTGASVRIPRRHALTVHLLDVLGDPLAGRVALVRTPMIGPCSNADMTLPVMVPRGIVARPKPGRIGDFEVDGLLAGIYFVVAEADGHAPRVEPIPHAVNSSTSFELRLVPLASKELAVRIVGASESATNAVVRWNLRTSFDPVGLEGSAVVDNTGHVTIAAPLGATVKLEGPFDTSALIEHWGLSDTLDLVKRVRLVGRIVDGGQPASGVYAIRAVHSSPPRPGVIERETSVLANDRFEWTSTSSLTGFMVQRSFLRVPGFERDSQDLRELHPIDRFWAVSDAGQASSSVVIDLQAPSGPQDDSKVRVLGRITPANDQVFTASMGIVRQGRACEEVHAPVRANGWFDFGDVGRGPYRIQVQRVGASEKPETIAEQQVEVDEVGHVQLVELTTHR